MSDKHDSGGILKVAVITGQHVFDVPAFHQLFRSMPEFDAYIQDLQNLCADEGGVLDEYDVLLFYNMHRATPGGRVLQTLERLATRGQGIAILHHAVLAFRDWAPWSDIVGMKDRSFSYYHDQTVSTEIADAQHPIVRGLEPWDMVDETYLMADAGEGSQILLTTDHPKSMGTLGWTRTYGNARVFCYVAGHDAQAYTNASFRTVLSRGIRWAAGKL